MTLHRFFERLIWLCMLPLVVLGVVLVTTQLRALEERRHLVEQSLARAAARNLDELLEVRLTSLELLARVIRETATDVHGALQLEKARVLAQHYLQVQGTHVLIGSGQSRLLLNTRVPQGQALPEIRAHPAQALIVSAISKGDRAVSDVFIGQLAKTPLVALAIPLPIDGSPSVALMTTVEALEMQHRLQKYELPHAWSLTLRDSTGHRIAHAGPSTAASGPFVLDSEDRRVRVNLSQAPWTLELHAPPASLLDSPRRQAGLLIFTLLVTVALAYWAGRLASRRLSRALASLTQPAAEPTAAEDIDEVRQVLQRMRRLHHERLEAQERERQRIGLELHDDLQQRLAVLRHDVQLMQTRRSPQEDPAQEGTAFLLQRIDDTISATRQLVNDLRPPVLDDFGVAEGLRLLIQRLREAHGLNIDLLLTGEEKAEDLPKPVATALYRVTQEALTNVRKHAQSSTVSVTLDLHDPEWVTLEIADDGVGFEAPSSAPVQSHGLRGMLERVQSLQGSLHIDSKPGEGTVIQVRLPLHHANPDGPTAPADKTGHTEI